MPKLSNYKLAILLWLALVVPCLAQNPPVAQHPDWINPTCTSLVNTGDCNNYGYLTPTIFNTFFNDSTVLDFGSFATGKTSCFHQAGTNSWLVPYTTNSDNNGFNFFTCYQSAAAAITSTGVAQTIVMQCFYSGTASLSTSCAAPLILTGGSTLIPHTNCTLQNQNSLNANFCLTPIIQHNYANPAYVYVVPSTYSLLPAQNNRLNPYPFTPSGSVCATDGSGFPLCNDLNGNSIQNDLWRMTIQDAKGTETLMLQPGASYIRFVGGELTTEATQSGAPFYANSVTGFLFYSSGSPEGQNRVVGVCDGASNCSYGGFGYFQVVERNAPGKPLVVSQSPTTAPFGTTGQNITVSWINNPVTSTKPNFTNPTGTGVISGQPTTTITVTVNDATFPPFEKGQYIADVAGIIPAATTITAVSGTNPYTLTVSNTLTTNSASDGIFVWPYIIWAGGISPQSPPGSTVTQITTPVCTNGTCTSTATVNWPAQGDPFQRVSVSNGTTIAVPMMNMMFQLTGASGCSGSTNTNPNCGDSTIAITTDASPTATACSGNGPQFVTHNKTPQFTICFDDPNAFWASGDILSIGGAADPLSYGTTNCPGTGNHSFTVATSTHAYVTACGNGQTGFANALIRAMNVAIRHRITSGCSGGANFCETVNSGIVGGIQISDTPQWLTTATPSTAAPGDTLNVVMLQGKATTGVAWTTAMNCSTVASCANTVNFAGNYQATDTNCTTNGKIGATSNFPQGAGCIDVNSFTVSTTGLCAGATSPCAIANITIDPHTMDGANHVILDRMFVHGRDTDVGCPAGTVACPLGTTQYGPAQTPVRVAYTSRGNWNATTTYNIDDQVVFTDGLTYTLYGERTSLNQSPPSFSKFWTPNAVPCTGVVGFGPRTPLANINGTGIAGNTADSGLCAYTTAKGGGEWPVYWAGGGAQDVTDAAEINGTYSAVIDSYFDEIHVYNQDYADVYWKPSNGFIKIDNNYLGQATEHVFSGGSGDISASPWNGYEIEIRQNYLPTPPAYQFAGLATIGYKGPYVQADCANTASTGTFNRCDDQCFGQTRPGCQVWTYKNSLEFKLGKLGWFEGNVADGNFTGVNDFPQLAQIVEFDPRGGQQGNVLSIMEDMTFINNAGINMWGGMLSTSSDPQCYENGSTVAYTDPQCAEKAPFSQTNGPWSARLSFLNNFISRLTSLDEGTAEEVGNQGIYTLSQIGNGNGRDVIVQHNTNVIQASHDYTKPTTDYLGWQNPQNGTIHGNYFNQQIGMATFPTRPNQSYTHNYWWLDNVSFCNVQGQSIAEGLGVLYNTTTNKISGAMYDPATSPFWVFNRYSGNINYLPSNFQVGGCGGQPAVNAAGWAAAGTAIGGGFIGDTDSPVNLLGGGIFFAWTQNPNTDELWGQDPTLIDSNTVASAGYNASLWEGSGHTNNPPTCDVSASNTTDINNAIFGHHATTGVCVPLLKQAIQFPFGVKTGVYGVLPLVITTTGAMSDGEQSLAYSQTVTAVGGVTPYTWVIPKTGSLPTGITETGSTNVIAGTPSCTNYPCTSTFTAQVTDTALTVAQSGSLTITVFAALTFPAQTPPTGAIDTDYSYAIQTTGGDPPLTFSVTSGNMPICGVGLLDGLCLNAASGTISGIAIDITNPLTDTSTYRVCDKLNVCQSRALTVVINSNLVITSAACGNGTINVLYTCNLTATGGASPYSWSISSGTLCTGLSLTASTTLNTTITGTVTTPQTCSFTVTITDNNAVTASQPETINIQNVTGQIVVSCAPNCHGASNFMPNGVIGQNYGPYAMTATGGSPPYTFSISAGGLPKGLTLNPTTGVISGIPTKVQQGLTPTIKATDGFGDIPGTIRLNFTIKALSGESLGSGIVIGKKVVMR